MMTPQERSEVENEVSDRYKDENGFRPRFLQDLDDEQLIEMLCELRAAASHYIGG